MSRITRRDFLNGAGVAVGAGAFAGSVSAAFGNSAAADYPPARTGMRGSHDGAFEVMHARAWEGRSWPRPARQTDNDYDLVVVGAGISGLAAAFFYRSRVGADARILVLDNHDDIGGHARRNEFTVEGRHLIGYGGSQTLENPGRYSVVSRNLLTELGVRTERFERYFDSAFATRHGLDEGVLFNDGLRPSLFSANLNERARWQAVGEYPLSAAAREALKRICADQVQLNETAQRMALDPERVPVEQFLREGFAMPEDGLAFLRALSRPLWGSGLDTLSIAESVLEYQIGDPLAAAVSAVHGLQGVSGRDEHEPYICHFPDGNASIARLLARSLVPEFADGRTMEDIVRATARYGTLDRAENSTRIRLGSTVVEAVNLGSGHQRGVEVTYVRNGTAERVRGKHCVMACYNNVLPHVMPELSDHQRDALQYPEKVPYLMVNVALRNWQAIARSGVGTFYAPDGFVSWGGMDFPVSMGGYHYTRKPSDPAVLHLWHAAATGPLGSDAKAQFKAGRYRLYQMPFADIEQAVFDQLRTAWGAHGLEPARDVAAITVNRWPHGYAYEYMDLYDDPSWGRGAGPHILGRQQVGNISIANSDSEQYAYVNGAIDAAHRAVRELTT